MHPKHFAVDDIDEVVASAARIHLEQLSDNAVMVIVPDDTRSVHFIARRTQWIRCKCWSC